MKTLKPDFKKKDKRDPRWSYQNSKSQFLEWVNGLGLDKTWIGYIISRLDEIIHLRWILSIFAFSIVISTIITWDFSPAYLGYQEGDLAKFDIKSPVTFEVVDHEQAFKKRLEAEESIPPVYDYDANLYEQIKGRVRFSFRRFRYLLSQGVSSESGLSPAEMYERKAEFDRDWGRVTLSREAFEWLVKNRFRPSIESIVIQSLDRWGGYKIVDDLKSVKQTSRQGRIIVKVLEKDFKGEEFIADTSTLVSQAETKARAGEQTYWGQFKDNRDTKVLLEIVGSQIVPNLTFNKQETESRRQRARDTVVSPVIQIKKGQIIVREGSPIQKIHVATLDELSRLKSKKHREAIVIFTALFLTIITLSFGGFWMRMREKAFITSKDLVVMATVLIFVLGLSKFLLYIGQTAFLQHFPKIPASFYSYIIPVVSGVMLVGLLIPRTKVIWIFSFIVAVCLGLLAERDFGFMVVCFVSSIVAGRGVIGCQNRNDLYFAGLKTAFVNSALIFCVTLLEPMQSNIMSALLWNTGAGFMGAIFSSFIALMLTPLLESVFTYTTDVKLMELSNLNHPLLKDLIVLAPGTYHHSLVVGSMCEAAAEEIGANPLLARVCAYYHDIGKTHYAQYFIENQRPGENRHDQISPGMSKTILVAHVKDGVEMGLNYKLGKPIIDVIKQHHGTTVISFFYHKAKSFEDAAVDEVREDEYRYPGPKPQFREAALCMLADSIEAAARSLDEPTPSRLQNIVRTIVQKKFLDGQLDECDLTLKDLSKIEEAFARVLLGIYHQRIDYPTARNAEIRKDITRISNPNSKTVS